MNKTIKLGAGPNGSLELEILICDLKGQCHEMVVEIRPYSDRLGIN
jgi:hypothetical protein